LPVSENFSNCILCFIQSYETFLKNGMSEVQKYFGSNMRFIKTIMLMNFLSYYIKIIN